MDADEKILEAWKTTIDVQKHFNELELRIRSIAITVLAAFLAATGYAMKEGMKPLSICALEIPVTSVILISAAVCWFAFFVMDRFWYHRLLQGAVKHGLAIEDSVREEFPQIALTRRIGDESPITIGKRKFGSSEKMNFFYLSILGLLLTGALVAVLNHSELRRVSATSGIAASHQPKPLTSVTPSK